MHRAVHIANTIRAEIEREREREKERLLPYWRFTYRNKGPWLDAPTR